MKLNEKHFDKAQALLEQRRSINRATEQLRHDEVCAKIPEYAQLELLLADTSRELITLVLNREGNTKEKLDQLEQNNRKLQENMKQLLKIGGFPEDHLDPIYTCPLCKDKGTYDNKWCECFRCILLDLAAKELNDISPLKLSNFDSFSLDYYSDEKDENLGTSARAVMKHNLEFCRQYADGFTTDSESIFMSGCTGLGKTHLSLAIANTVIGKGYSVIYGSIPELLRSIEPEFYGRSDEDTMRILTQCDLLILDDLGAEMEKQLYPSMIYEIVNSRISRGLPMIINTNLSVKELKSRYQDRICSRLFSMEMLMFTGTDIRLRLKKK